MPWASCGASQADARTHITGWQATFPCPPKGRLPGCLHVLEPAVTKNPIRSHGCSSGSLQWALLSAAQPLALFLSCVATWSQRRGVPLSIFCASPALSSGTDATPAVELLESADPRPATPASHSRSPMRDHSLRWANSIQSSDAASWNRLPTKTSTRFGFLRSCSRSASQGTIHRTRRRNPLRHAGFSQYGLSDFIVISATRAR